MTGSLGRYAPFTEQNVKNNILKEHRSNNMFINYSDQVTNSTFSGKTFKWVKTRTLGVSF